MNPFVPTETTFYASGTSVVSYPTSMTTSWVDLRIRGESSSSSKKSTTKHTTTSKCTNAQLCQTGQDTNALTIALAVTIPCVVFLSIIFYFMYRSYKKGKQEAKEDDDPDFYGETTILPDYPRKDVHMMGGGNAGPDDDSLYSSGQNPFTTDNTRYPSAAIQGYSQQGRNFSNYNRGAPSIHTTQNDPYYESFTLPYQHTMGSKHSLNEFAKGLGSEYQAYQISSRPGSRAESPYRSQNSSSMNLNQQLDSKTRNLTEKYSHSYEDETTDSPYSFNETKNVLDDDDEPIRRNENVFADPGYNKRHSDASFSEDEPEQLNSNSIHERAGVPQEESIPAQKGVKFDAEEDNEEDEDIKRMKSVYKVYFDRENSVKKPGNAGGEDVPPLPNVDIGEEQQDEVRELQSSNSQLLSVSQPQGEKKHRVVSSVYSTVPLQFDQHAVQQQELEPSYQPQQQYQQQQYPPQQQYQQQQYPQQQQQYQAPSHHMYKPPSRYGSPSASPRLQPQFSGQPVELPPLQTVPTPSKIEYTDVVTSTDYAPTKSLTAGTRPADLTIRPFNPLHNSDQLFSPTSPVSPSTGQFLPPDASMRDALPPSPHHLRHSIVMMDPVGIGKEKIYRPAGAFSQMNSANSSRAGSLTSQSAYAPPQQTGDGELLPRSGSKADLRLQLGASENYNFA